MMTLSDTDFINHWLNLLGDGLVSLLPRMKRNARPFYDENELTFKKISLNSNGTLGSLSYCGMIRIMETSSFGSTGGP